MSDSIFVTGLLIHAHHGVMEHEEKVGQRFIIDLELSLDLSAAARSDKLADTVSYSTIVETATTAFTSRNYRLVEAAAASIADAILAKFARVTHVHITVHKPHAPMAAIFGDVGVTLKCSRHD
jgi:7,8-dihydroneopterin aldolase/epimerase/oxygenase